MTARRSAPARNRAQERADEIKAARFAPADNEAPRPPAEVLTEHVVKVTAARGSR